MNPSSPKAITKITGTRPTQRVIFGGTVRTAEMYTQPLLVIDMSTEFQKTVHN